MGERNPLRVTGATWSEAVTEAQQWAWSHGQILKLTTDQMTQIEELWEKSGQDPHTFRAILDALQLVNATLKERDAYDAAGKVGSDVGTRQPFPEEAAYWTDDADGDPVFPADSGDEKAVA